MGRFSIYLTLSFTMTATSWAGGAKKPKDPAQKRQKCSYACKEIPRSNEILTSFGSGAVKSALPQSFRALVWNIYKSRNDAFERDFLALSKNSDILLLQEVFHDRVSDAIFRKAGRFSYGMATSFFMKNEVRTGVANASKAVSRRLSYEQTPDLEPFVKSPKVVTITDYKIENSSKSVRVANIHGINFAGDEALMRQLRPVVKQLKAHNGPLLFAGDFNTKNDTRLKQTIELLRDELGMEYVPFAGDHRKKKLDLAFARGLEVERSQLLTQVEGSDHPAILLDLKLK